MNWRDHGFDYCPKFETLTTAANASPVIFQNFVILGADYDGHKIENMTPRGVFKWVIWSLWSCIFFVLEEHIITDSGEACNFFKSTFRPSSQRELILARNDKPAPHYDDHHLKTHVGVDVDLRRRLACKSDELTRVEFPHNLRISRSSFDQALIFY